MKVVLFCGGKGMRLYPTTEVLPKPLISVGGKPLLLLLMKYYSYFGNKDFILCLGYKGEKIKKYFLDYDEFLSGDFVLSKGGKRQKLFKSDIEDWKITFADTGLNSTLGDRLKAVQKYLEGEDNFLANYADGLTDLYLPNLIDFFKKSGKIACLISVKPSVTFHYVSTSKEGYVKKICQLNQAPLRINGGFFVFKNQIFDYIKPNEDLVCEPFQRLIKKGELISYDYDGFWASLDTYKDKQRLEEMASHNASFWEIWNHTQEEPGDKQHA